MISVLNFKEFSRGAIKGFFDLRYHGLTIKGCKLMNGQNGLWFSFPQVKGEKNGEATYFDQLFMSSLEREHVKKLVLLDLAQQGHLEQLSSNHPPPRQSNTQFRTPEGENLKDHFNNRDDDIPF